MKKLFFLSLLVILTAAGFSQSDTLFTKQGKKIPCKIYEINDFEFRYRMASNPDGPLFVIDKTTVLKYVLANGYTEIITPDELSLEHEHKEILGNREVIKVHPFSFAFNHVSIAYEKVIKVGMNLDAELGYVNSSISSYDYNGVRNYGYYRIPFVTGAYIKPGVKFFLGQDFSVKGLKYAHPLKGRYIKLDLAFAYLHFDDVSYNYYTYMNPTTTYTPVSSNVEAFSYGGFVNYGRQFILGNLFTLDYYFGVGFTGQSMNYSNPSFNTPSSQYYSYMDFSRSVSNYYGFSRIPTLGLSGTAGFRIGYIIPSKKSRIEQKAEKVKFKNQ